MSVPYNFEKSTGIKEVYKPFDIPASGFLIQFYEDCTVYHEGDERSRTNPGHGYPAYTEQYTKVRQFLCETEAIWKNAAECLLAMNLSRTDFVAMRIQRGRLKITTSVEIEEATTIP